MQTELLAENRTLGFAGVSTTAPEWVRTYIIEHRSAVIAKRPMNPEYLRTFTAGCERRSAVAATFAGSVRPPVISRPVAPTRKTETLEEQAKRQAARIWADDIRAAKHLKVVRDAHGKLINVVVDREAEARREQFGEGQMSADEVEYWKREFAKRLES